MQSYSLLGSYNIDIYPFFGPRCANSVLTTSRKTEMTVFQVYLKAILSLYFVLIYITSFIQRNPSLFQQNVVHTAKIVSFKEILRLVLQQIG